MLSMNTLKVNYLILMEGVGSMSIKKYGIEELKKEALRELIYFSELNEFDSHAFRDMDRLFGIYISKAYRIGKLSVQEPKDNIGIL